MNQTDLKNLGIDTRARCRCGSFQMRFKVKPDVPGVEGIESIHCDACGEYIGASADDATAYHRRLLAETDGYGPPSWRKSAAPA